jgi:ribonuclease P protein component
MIGETLHVAKSPPRSQKNALKSAHFVLSALAPSAFVQKPEISSVKSNVLKSEKLFMAIPKRLLKRAVDRNAVKRICREAWRLKNTESPKYCEDLHSENAHSETLQPALVKPKLIKLVSRPTFESTKQLKYLIRTDIDVLFAKLK